MLSAHTEQLPLSSRDDSQIQRLDRASSHCAAAGKPDAKSSFAATLATALASAESKNPQAAAQLIAAASAGLSWAKHAAAYPKQTISTQPFLTHGWELQCTLLISCLMNMPCIMRLLDHVSLTIVIYSPNPLQITHFFGPHAEGGAAAQAVAAASAHALAAGGSEGMAIARAYAVAIGIYSCPGVKPVLTSKSPALILLTVVQHMSCSV